MNRVIAILLTLCATSAAACDAGVCRVDPDTLILPQIITFDHTRSSFGPGHNIDGLLVLPGASFGDHFAGQRIIADATFDAFDGTPLSPLTVLPGPPGQNLSVVRDAGNAFLNGYGISGFPRRDSQGEGAVAVLFDDDQSALAFELRGGEGGAAMVHFFRRDGKILATIRIAPTGEFSVGFQRNGAFADIAGLIVTNTDPQGMAIDTLRFGKPPDLG